MSVTPNRLAWTCEPCRKRKVRCDRKSPCIHCTRRGEACTWAPGALQGVVPEETSADSATVKDLQKRLLTVEAILREHHLTLAPVRGATPKIEESESEDEIEIEELADPPPRQGATRPDVAQTDSFDHRIIGAVTDRSRPSAFLRSRVRQILQHCLPEIQQCDRLVESYLLNVEWMYRPLHVPSFMRSYAAFLDWWAHDTSGRPGDMAVADIQFMALLMMVLCLGTNFDSGSQESDTRLENSLYQATNDLLGLSDHLANHSVTVIQTLIQLCIFCNNRSMSNTHHSHLSLAIKMAHTLDLGRVDSNAIANDRSRSTRRDADFSTWMQNQYPYAAEGPVDQQAELKRRLWWSLMAQDYYAGASANSTYFIHSNQSRTYLFRNVDDETAGHDEELDIYRQATASTYHLVKIPFAGIAKDMIDLYNEDRLTYDAVLGLEKKIFSIYENLPAYFKLGYTSRIPQSKHVEPRHLEWQRLFLGFTWNNRLIRLHRPYLSRSYADPTVAHSRQVTLTSAEALLELGEHGRTIAFPGSRWWVTLVHIFTAGIVFTVELQFQVRAGLALAAPECALRRQQLGRVIDLLHPAATTTPAASRALKVLLGLRRQIEDGGRRARKRKRKGTGLDAERGAVRRQESHASEAALDTSVGGDTVDTSPLPEFSVDELFQFDEFAGIDWDHLLETFPPPPVEGEGMGEVGNGLDGL